MISTFFLFESNLGPQLFEEDLESFIKRTDINNIMWSPKLNGVRCWIKVDKNNIKYISRRKKIFKNLGIFDGYIRQIADKISKDYNVSYPIYLDSELGSKDKKLETVMTQLRRKYDIDPSIFQINIFDVGMKNLEFVKRHELITKIINILKPTNIQILPYKKLQNLKQINDLMEKMYDQGYEGIMLINSKSLYNFDKRSYNGVKVKKIHTIDLKVVEIQEGNGRLKGKLGAFIVDYNGVKIKVSGRMSDKEREQFFKNPPIGKYIEIKYKEKTSIGSLKEPVFLRVREDK